MAIKWSPTIFVTPRFIPFPIALLRVSNRLSLGQDVPVEILEGGEAELAAHVAGFPEMEIYRRYLACCVHLFLLFDRSLGKVSFSIVGLTLPDFSPSFVANPPFSGSW